MDPPTPGDHHQKSPPPQQPPPSSYGHYTTGVPVQPATSASSPTPWSTGFCGCFDDLPNCCITCWFPCITFGQIAEIVDKGTTSCGVHGALYVLLGLVTGCACIYSCVYRSKMRRQFMLPESPCNDCLLHCCCEPCALCQEYRELKHRGFDMSVGWEGNTERQNHGLMMAPVVHREMNRQV